MQKEPQNNYQIFNNNNIIIINNIKFEFKFESIKRKKNKVSYEKFNYDEYIKKNKKNNNNIKALFQNNNGINIPKNINNKYKYI